MPHGLPFSPHAPDVHGPAHGGPLPHHRHPPADPPDSPHLPVGPLPQEPRRTHPGNGHRRGAGLHVPGLFPGPPGPHQFGHPPPPGAPVGEPPPPPRTDD